MEVVIKMKGYSNETLNLWRLQSIDRALMAGRLVEPEFYEDTEKAIKEPNEKLFYETCERAKIFDQELIAHMWDIIEKAYSVYQGQSPGFLW